MIVLLAFTLVAASPALPDTLDLAQCYREAEAHYPLQQQVALQEAITALRVENLDARYLPALSLNGQAAYYSDVVDFAETLPGAALPQISQDQYKVALTVDQLVYDGGRIARQKALERAQRDLTQEEVAVSVYMLREQVNAAYFGVLLRQAQAASLETLEADIQARLDLVRSQVAQGVALAAQADVLEAERIKIRQQQAEVAANRRAALAVLGTLMGRSLADEEALALPEVAIEEAEARQRPEYEVFTLTKTRLAEQEKLAALKNRPRITSFAEAAFGRPTGLDFLETDFKPFYSLGLRVQWPFWDWRTSRREQEALALQQQMVTAQEETFDQQITVAVQQEIRDIARLEELLQSDQEIIDLRERITAQATSQLENGVMTATDYLIERNAEHQARLTQQLHRIQLAQAQVRYATTIGKP